MARTIVVAAAQTGPVLTRDVVHHVAAACELVEQAAARDAEIICFAELFLTPFFPNTLDPDYESFFMDLPDPRTEPLFALARERRMAMIFPYGERSGQYCYNAALVVDGEGRALGTYRKTHIPAILPSKLAGGTGSYEKFYFTPGRELPVFEARGVRFGIQICYDRKYPEGSRVLALDGAEILFMPICAATYGETALRGNNRPLWLESFRRAREAGVPIAAGGDIGNRYPHGSNARELELLVREGMTPLEAIHAATGVAARALRREDSLGSLAPGKLADLVLVDGDPLSDIRLLQDMARIRLVLQGGRAVAGTLRDAPHERL